MKLILNKKSFLKNYWDKKHFFLPGGISKLDDNFIDLDNFDLPSTKALEKKVFIQDGGKYTNFTNVKKKLHINTPLSKLFYKTNHIHQLSFEIKNLFDFIPQYLIDDVMISLSNIKGSVGKHKDNYSVFLIQGKGIKNWKIYENKKVFSYTAKEGDILYVPPGIDHYGISQTEVCNTYSVGFRSPDSLNLKEIFNDYIFNQLDQTSTIFFQNKTFSKQKALISNDIKDFFIRNLDYKPIILDEFIGIYLTNVDLDLFKTKVMSLKKFKEQLKKLPLFLNQKSKALYFGVNFYINGIKINVEPSSIKEFKRFFNKQIIDASKIDNKSILLLFKLFKKEYIVFKRKFVI
ncbi:MAG: cupin domain-containing protein [Methylophilaceae bacterium]